MKNIIMILLLILTLNAYSETLTGIVVKIIDGDTIDVKINETETIRVRLYGIDTPELKQPYGKEAKLFLEKYLLNGNVDVISYGYDRYKRLIGVVYHKATIVNGFLVAIGLAWVYEKYCTDAFYLEPWLKLQEEAKRKKVNIWSNPNSISPWEYRKKKRGKK